MTRFPIRQLLACAALAALAAPGCDWFARKSGADVVVTVGEVAITRAMVDLRAKTLEDNPAARDPALTALTQLVQGELAAIVVNRHGEVVTPEALEHFWLKFPDKIPAAARDAAASVADRGLMLRALARPEFAAMMADGFFAESEIPHAEVAERAAVMHAGLLANPGRFEAVAREAGLEVDRLWIGPRTLRSVLMPAEGKIAAPVTEVAAGEAPADVFSAEAREQAAELYKMLAAAKSGSVHHRLVSSPDAFQIYKVEARRTDEMLVSVITLAKQSFDAWFWPAARDIPVRFTDRDAGRDFAAAVPWARHLRIVE